MARNNHSGEEGPAEDALARCATDSAIWSRPVTRTGVSQNTGPLDHIEQSLTAGWVSRPER